MSAGERKKHYTLLYAIVQFGFWFAYGTAVGYSGAFLLACGLSNTLIGLITALVYGVTVFLQPLLAARADRRGGNAIKNTLITEFALAALTGMALMGTFGRNAVISAFFGAAAVLLFQMALPFANALGTQCINAGMPVRFSVARGVGSLGYAAMSWSVGQLMASFGEKILPPVMAVSSLFVLAAVVLFPVPRAADGPRERAFAGQEKHLGAFFGQYRSFCITLIGLVLIYMGHVFINTFEYQIVVFKGGNSANMGTALAIAAGSEILTMFGFSRMLRLKDCSFWFRLSGVFFALKSLFTLLAPSMGVFYLVQLLQPMGWGLMSVAGVYYVNQIMAEGDKTKGQALLTMAFAVSKILASLSGGILIDLWSVNGMLLAAVLSGAAGCLIVYSSKTAEGDVK